MVNHSSVQGSRPETSFGPAFRLKVSIKLGIPPSR
jgi:hypothetical protein